MHRMPLGPRFPAGVTVDNVSRTFKRTRALDRVSLTAGPGVVAAVIGPNGCGKTTLLRILAGVLDPDSGQAQLAGVPPGRGVAAYVPAGDRALYWRITARENLEFFARIGGAVKNRKEFSQEAASRLGASDLLSRRVGTLSTGQRRRIMLARGLVAGPPILLLDEPYADLDDAGCGAVATATHRWAEEGGTVIYAAPGADGGPQPDLTFRLNAAHRRTES